MAERAAAAHQVRACLSGLTARIQQLVWLVAKTCANKGLQSLPGLPGQRTGCRTGYCTCASPLQPPAVCGRSPGTKGTVAILAGYLLKLDPFGGLHWDAGDLAVAAAYAAPVLLTGVPASLGHTRAYSLEQPNVGLSRVLQPVELGAHMSGCMHVAASPACDPKRRRPSLSACALQA